MTESMVKFVYIKMCILLCDSEKTPFRWLTECFSGVGYLLTSLNRCKEKKAGVTVE